jgi:prefoldin subunit 5
MAISTNTESLISFYNQKISLDTEQIKQVEYTEQGFSIQLPNGGEYKLPAIEESIGYFAEPTEKLDKRIVELNNQIVGLQNTLLDVRQTANSCGCGGPIGFDTITSYADTAIYRGYTYTSPNPFEEIDGTLTSGNAGIGTESLFGITEIGVYYGNIGIAATILPICPGVTNCTGYATSESNLNAQISALQSERNALAQKVNVLKNNRSEFEVRRYGFNASKEALNVQIQSTNSIISFLQDPANDEWL